MSVVPIENYFQKLAEHTDSDSDNNTSKRNRSEGSDAGNSPKRIIYDAEDEVINLPDDAPVWVAALLRTMNNVNAKVEETNSKIEDMSQKFECYKSVVDGEINAMKSSVAEMKAEYDQKISDITKSASFLSDSFESQKKTNEDLLARMAELERSQDFITKSWKSELCTQAASIESAEQYSRRNCALLHGVKEVEGESTDELVTTTVKEHLAISLDERDIDRSHRLGAPRKDGRPRPIIVKFARYNTRATVFRAKKRFKGTSLLLTESLTKRRMEVLNEARKQLGNKNVWTSDGEIFTKKDGKTVNVRFISSVFPTI